TLTAHWGFSVTYTSEHGTVPETITVEKNTILSESQLPVLSDDTLVFKGWFDCETKAMAGEYQVTGNVTLTAHWAATATVSYHSNFGTAPESFDVELNQTLTAGNLADISCSPYTFLGWYYEKDEDNNGTGSQAQTGDEIAADTQLYAKWETATISFSTEFGTVPSIKKYTGENFSEDEIPSLEARTGYSFDGWFNGSSKLTTNYVVSDDVAFNEGWSVIQYQIIYHTNGGEIPDDAATVYTIEDSVDELVSATKEDKVFGGWYTDPDCDPHTKITGWESGKTGNVDLYAFYGDCTGETFDVYWKSKKWTSSKIIVVVNTDNVSSVYNTLSDYDSSCKKQDKSYPTGFITIDLSHTEIKVMGKRTLYCLKGLVAPYGLEKINGSSFHNLSSFEIDPNITWREWVPGYGWVHEPIQFTTDFKANSDLLTSLGEIRSYNE
ncbi:MAG: InlB B-repeat-containing protein, partial [Treponema sp.]|nr:InlB B-repeat-containing protein [Treponema sp.]